MKRYIPYITLCLMLIGCSVWAIPPSPPSTASSGQPLDSALTSLTSKVFAKTALTGAGGLDTVLEADIADGDIGLVSTIAGVIYFFVYEASSSASESSPSVITPDDTTGNGRWLLKLQCDGSACSVPQATTGAYSTLLEGSGNGTNFRKTSAPDDLTADLNLRHANALPTANQFQLYPAPTDGVAAYSWKTYGETIEVDGHIDQTALTAAQVSNTVIYNTGQGAGDVFLLLPAAAAGYSFLATVGTAQAKHFGVEAASGDKIYLIAADGTVAAGDDAAGVVMTAAVPGQSFACWTFKTDAYDWMCKAISTATSTFAAHAHSTP